MRFFVWTAVLLVALAAGWRYRTVVTHWLTPEPPPKPIVFDNGTVRDTSPPASAASAVSSALPNGVLRKCVRGSETQYTNVTCPPGFKEKAVASDRVTVLEGTAPAPVSKTTEPAGERRKNVRDVLDADPGSLREKAIDRATR